ncbi:uncharacterized protein PHALS_11740 [Plasmopara halstedii]|uniref:Uncharacterized protein n=1 Tax=Plasmopara halstedii TaxID=4781 RepID=A0A0P1AKG2_PLAHL|nr:uncharacterized protein PHALS_11740 [Plasmopara halstedii]CEG41390.1 hypothetical protein PHALS_11740 [Plasmopara halstedii]|eukprot:XP_024577759.1 hypothetical protein PHALS_11740 [Plasmopara halstedii]
MSSALSFTARPLSAIRAGRTDISRSNAWHLRPHQTENAGAVHDNCTPFTTLGSLRLRQKLDRVILMIS